MSTFSNLFIDQGSNFNTTIDLSDTPGLSLTNYTAAGKIAKSYDGTTKATFSATVDSNSKVVSISLTAAQTAAIKPGRYVYDIIIVSPDSPAVVTRILEGQIDVTPGVTFDASAPET
tara:strand:- start:78 stop:428 length:351 start_codon:yes stop_codon:yes gene_type:complete